MASGDTLCTFFPQDAEFPTSNYPTFDTRAMAEGIIVVLDFDDTNPETCYFSGFMPLNYGGGGVTVTTMWMASSATTGTISWDLSFMSITDDVDDLDTKSYAAANNANPTTASASGEVDYIATTFTSGAADSIAAGEFFRLRASRDALGTTSTDNMTGDMELVCITIKET